MLVELQKYESRPRGDEIVGTLIAAAHHLIRNQFIVDGDRNIARHYERLNNREYENYFSSLFHALGYRFEVNDEEKWIGIFPASEDITWPKMQIGETIALLVLALLWREGVESGDVEQYGRVIVTFNELFDRYSDIVSKNRKTAIQPREFENIIEGLRRRHIIARIGEPDDGDFEIEIRPIVLHLAPVDVRQAIEDFLRSESAFDVTEEDAGNDEELINA